ncbi:MAG TPA: hypothetical protein VIK34_03550 [Clostridiaceae bacterium]
MEKNKEYRNYNMFQSGDVYFEYLKEMKREQADDSSDYSASFMTF